MFRTKFVDKIKTHILCSIMFFVFPKIVPFMRIMWKNIVEPIGPQMTIWRMRFACWIPKATNSYSEYVILITFQRQQWLCERPLTLQVHCLYYFGTLICHGRQYLPVTDDVGLAVSGLKSGAVDVQFCKLCHVVRVYNLTVRALLASNCRILRSRKMTGTKCYSWSLPFLFSFNHFSFRR
jgi:hypothetical protein